MLVPHSCDINFARLSCKNSCASYMNTNKCARSVTPFILSDHVLVLFHHNNSSVTTNHNIQSLLQNRLREKPTSRVWNGRTLIFDTPKNMLQLYNVFTDTIEHSFPYNSSLITVSQTRHSSSICIDQYSKPIELYNFKTSTTEKFKNMEKPCCCATFEMRDGTFLLAWGDHVASYNRNTLEFKFILNKSPRKRNIRGRNVGFVCFQLKDGRIILGIEDRMVLFDEKYNRLHRFDINVDVVVEIAPGKVFCSAHDSFYCVDLCTNEEREQSVDTFGTVMSMILLAGGFLMIGTSEGIFILNKEYKIVRQQNVDGRQMRTENCTTFSEIAPNIIGYLARQTAHTYNAITGGYKQYTFKDKVLSFVCD